MRWLALIVAGLLVACAHKSGTVHLDDVRASLRQLGKDISKATASVADPATNSDPATFRGRLEAENKRLHERFEGLRERSRTALESSDERASREQREGLERELAETQKELDAMDAKLREQGAAAKTDQI